MFFLISCTQDPKEITKITKEKEEKQQVEEAMVVESQKQIRDQEIATAQQVLDSPASIELCKAFHSQPTLCSSVGCDFVSKAVLFGSSDIRNKCNFGCCPNLNKRTGQSPTIAVCNALKTKSHLCSAAGCIYRASSSMFSEGKCELPNSNSDATTGDVSSPDMDFVGEDESIVSPDMDPTRQKRLKQEFVKAEKTNPESQKPRNEGMGEVKDSVRTTIVKGLKDVHNWIKKSQYGCRTGFFAKMKGHVQPRTCQSCISSSVGGLFTSQNSCSWCALDGHSSNIGFCVSDRSICQQIKTSELKNAFGENVRFSTSITEVNSWQCPNLVQSQLRQCKRGCDIRCQGKSEKEWSQQNQQNTGNVCIEPSKCESACAESMPKQLEEILFEERIARTTYAKYVSMELCIRGCTDRKVGFQDIDAKITTWEFQEIDQSKQECNDMCELTVTGTVQKKQEMDLNDATIARQSSSTTEDVH